MKYTHMMPDTMLPPVDCPLVIDLDGVPTRASRPTFVTRQEKEDELLFVLDETGETVEGRFRWTYP